MTTSSTLRTLLALGAAAALSAMLVGCNASSSTTPAAHASTSTGGEVVARAERPILLTSAAERAPGTDLAFFDELETRPLAAQDDAIHAALLLATGSSGTTPRHRWQLASALGYTPDTYARPAREAVTVGEVSQLFAAVLAGKRPASPEDAVGIMVSRNVLKSTLPAFQGMTGAQLVTMIGAAQDAMRASGVARVALPNISASTAESATDEQAQSTTVNPVNPTPTSKGWVEGASVKPRQEANVDPAKPSTP